MSVWGLPVLSEDSDVWLQCAWRVLREAQAWALSELVPWCLGTCLFGVWLAVLCTQSLSRTVPESSA